MACSDHSGLGTLWANRVPDFNCIARSRPKAGVNGAGHRFCFEIYQVIEERTYARACTSIAD